MDVRLERARHRSELVMASGISLDSAYVEHCWLPVVGPSVVALLRRTYDLTADGPVSIDTVELSRLLGFGSGGRDLSSNSHLGHTLTRAHRYGLGRYALAGVRFRAYEMVGPVPARLVDQLPIWSRHRHRDELVRVADRLAAYGIDVASLGPTWLPPADARAEAPPTAADQSHDSARSGTTDRLDVLASRHSGHLHLSCG
jgi:hypothetical protein